MSIPVPADLALHSRSGDHHAASARAGAVARARILCVDDDERLLAGLELRLRRRFEVVTATGAAEALARLDRSRPFAVVVSDMRMPHADGATFLSAIRRVAPETTRVLLTGQADLQSAIAAVNEGEVFRFLLKPIETPALIEALDRAVAHHHEQVDGRVRAETVLRATMELLATTLTSLAPARGAACDGMRAMVADVATVACPTHGWIAEMATVALHLALSDLPDGLAHRWRSRSDVSASESRQVAQALGRILEILRTIPAAEEVHEILHSLVPREDGPAWRDRSHAASLPLRIVHLILAFEAHVLRGASNRVALDALTPTVDPEDARLVAILADSPSHLAPGSQRTPLGQLRPGRCLSHDVRLANGVLLLPMGHAVTEATLELLRSLDADVRQMPVLTTRAP
jgi:FixJ family two-component response regulator